MVEFQQFGAREHDQKVLNLSSIIENAPYVLAGDPNMAIADSFVGNSTGSSNSSSHSSNSSSHSASRAYLPASDVKLEYEL